MPDFDIRSDSVNVEQIMEQIRARIREKRGVDYTEEQIRELAAVKLEKFLDPRGVRSDLLNQFRKAMPVYEPPVLPNYSFEADTLFESHRGVIRFFRKLFQPLLKLFLFNPNPLIQALNIQARLNTMYSEREAARESSRRAMDQLYYELIHNLVVELTRTGIEVKNLKMRVESLASRLEFNERRARALESAVVYRPSDDDRPARPPQPPPPPPPRQSSQSAAPIQPVQVPQAPAAAPSSQPEPAPAPAPGAVPAEGPGQRSRRRRRRRGRRGGPVQLEGGQGGQSQGGQGEQGGHQDSSAAAPASEGASRGADATAAMPGPASAGHVSEDDGGPDETPDDDGSGGTDGNGEPGHQ